MRKYFYRIHPLCQFHRGFSHGEFLRSVEMFAVKTSSAPIRIYDNLLCSIGDFPRLFSRQECSVLIDESLLCCSPHTALVSAFDLLDHQVIEMARAANDLIANPKCRAYYPSLLAAHLAFLPLAWAAQARMSAFAYLLKWALSRVFRK